jgi:hypothetical protein
VTTTHRSSLRILVMALIAVLLLAASPPPANAAQGEVVVSDGDVASHVTQVNGRARVQFDLNSILNSCPSGMSSCFLEYRWLSKKNCLICWWGYDTPWTFLPAGTQQLNHCKSNGSYRFQLEVRLRWHAQVTVTGQMYGWWEKQMEIDSNLLVNKIIPIRVFNVTYNSGMTTSHLLQTNTATSAQSAPYTIATSGETYLSVPCS